MRFALHKKCYGMCFSSLINLKKFSSIRKQLNGVMSLLTRTKLTSVMGVIHGEMAWCRDMVGWQPSVRSGCVSGLRIPKKSLLFNFELWSAKTTDVNLLSLTGDEQLTSIDCLLDYYSLYIHLVHALAWIKQTSLWYLLVKMPLRRWYAYAK